MSKTPSRSPKVTAPGLRARKLSGQRITAVTAYDFPSAQWVDAAGIDVVLVGDSQANVVLGHESTIPLELEDALLAVRAVRRGVERPLLVADMPFGSYQISLERSMEAAVKLLKAGAEAVKLEGGRAQLELVERLAEQGIPVMGHLGLTPQSVHAMGGYKVQGREREAAERLRKDARRLEAAGAFSLVLEGIPSELAARITAELEIPTIGIGAGPDCDGQILVLHDLLGLSSGRVPRFVRQYAQLHELAVEALEHYRDDVIEGRFPSARESYHDRGSTEEPAPPATLEERSPATESS